MEKNKFANLSVSSFLKITSMVVIMGLILRVVLLFNPTTVVDYSPVGWFQIFVMGVLNDTFFAIISFSFFGLFLLFFSEEKYRRPWSYIIYGLLIVTYVILQFFNTPLHEFNASLTRVIC